MTRLELDDANDQQETVVEQGFQGWGQRRHARGTQVPATKTSCALQGKHS